MKRTAILITGMHRSGASVLAHTLKLAGCDLPRMSSAAGSANDAECQEPDNVVSLNDEILASAGSVWSDWTAIEPRWYESPVADAFREHAVDILESRYGDSCLFILKDPRICRLLPFWVEAARAFDADPRIVLPVRNPQDVALSLRKRDGIPIPVGHLLWLRHVLDAENASRGLKRAWLRYDRFLAEPHAILDGLSKSLDVLWPKHASARVQREIRGFLVQYLRRHRTPDSIILDDPTVSRWITASFEIFDRWASDDEQEHDMTALNDIRSAFDAAVPAFHGAFVGAEYVVAERDTQIEALNAEAQERGAKAEDIAAALAERDRRIDMLNAQTEERNAALTERDAQIEVLNAEAQERDAKAQDLAAALAERDRRIDMLNAQTEERNAALTERDAQIETLDAQVKERGSAQPGNKRSLSWGIMTTQHAAYIAALIEYHLRRHGWNAEKIPNAGVPQKFSHDYYFVMTPRVGVYARLPPKEKRISFQLEQSVSERWFTEQYIDTLRDSRCVLDYSMENFAYLQSRGVRYPDVYYLPLGGLPSYAGSCLVSNRRYDVLFYGDYVRSVRRRRLLDALKNRFNVLTVVDVYGQDMTMLIKAARIVINLHFYGESGLLESTRIYECLSLGTAVVSESSPDRAEYPELEGVVRYFEPGSINDMLVTVEDALKYPVATEDIEKAMHRSAKRFSFMFDRFLVGEGFLPEKCAYDLEVVEHDSSEMIAISMPETAERRKFFVENMVNFPIRFVIFDGMRSRPGIINRSLSHSVLASRALINGLSRLTIMEDDVLFPNDFLQKWRIVSRFLDLRSGEWDAFSGVIAELTPNVTVIWAVEFEGIIFALIDEMASTVFNVYSDRGMRMLSSWNPETTQGVASNVNRHIRGQERLRVIVTYPYFVERRKDALSTVAASHNDVYWRSIREAQDMLRRKIYEALEVSASPRHVATV